MMVGKWASFHLDELADGRSRATAIKEFDTQAEAQADAYARLIAFGHACWGPITEEAPDGPIIDLRGRAGWTKSDVRLR